MLVNSATQCSYLHISSSLPNTVRAVVAFFWDRRLRGCSSDSEPIPFYLFFAEEMTKLPPLETAMVFYIRFAINDTHLFLLLLKVDRCQHDLRSSKNSFISFRKVKYSDENKLFT